MSGGEMRKTLQETQGILADILRITEEFETIGFDMEGGAGAQLLTWDRIQMVLHEVDHEHRLDVAAFKKALGFE